MPTHITLYADADGVLSLDEQPGAKPVDFELADECRVSSENGTRRIVCELSLDDALRGRLLRPVFDKRLA